MNKLVSKVLAAALVVLTLPVFAQGYGQQQPAQQGQIQYVTPPQQQLQQQYQPAPAPVMQAPAPQFQAPAPLVQQPQVQASVPGQMFSQPQQVQAPAMTTPIVEQSQEVIKEETTADKAAFSPDIQKIVSKGELVVAMYAVDQPPFFMKGKDGTLIGFDVELATKMAEALGVKVRFNRDAQSFNGVIDIVASGKADIGISKLSYTLTRAKKVLYSKTYMTLKKTFLINRLKMAKAKSKRGAGTLQELIDHHEGTVGVIANSSYVNFAKQLFPKSTIVPLDSWGLESLDISLQGKILTIFRDDLEILKLIRRVPDSNFHVLPVTLKKQIDPIRMILPWDKGHLLEWVNGFLDSADINLTVDNLLNRYEDYFQWANRADNDSNIKTKEIKPEEETTKS